MVLRSKRKRWVHTDSDSDSVWFNGLRLRLRLKLRPRRRLRQERYLVHRKERRLRQRTTPRLHRDWSAAQVSTTPFVFFTSLHTPFFLAFLVTASHLWINHPGNHLLKWICLSAPCVRAWSCILTCITVTVTVTDALFWYAYTPVCVTYILVADFGSLLKRKSGD